MSEKTKEVTQLAYSGYQKYFKHTLYLEISLPPWFSQTLPLNIHDVEVSISAWVSHVMPLNHFQLDVFFLLNK